MGVGGGPVCSGRATLNLMDNAAKWSPATGTVRVSMQQISEHEVRLRVDDSGPGIPPEEREKVFERFYRSAEARSMPGSGLGLAIVKSVIERHEGAIEIKESSDGGTRMEVTLPGYRGEGDPLLTACLSLTSRRRNLHLRIAAPSSLNGGSIRANILDGFCMHFGPAVQVTICRILSGILSSLTELIQMYSSTVRHNSGYEHEELEHE